MNSADYKKIVHAVIAGRHYGTASGGHHHSILFNCPVCGDTWARFPVYHGAALQQWYGVLRSCRKCPPAWLGEIPGSIYYSNEAYLSGLPEQAWEYEALLMLDYQEKQNGEES
jgi:hypothetical protein